MIKLPDNSYNYVITRLTPDHREAHRMERLILNDLLKWKESKHRKPLIIKGVRQVGKTWILKEFGKRYYNSIAYFNFDEHEEYKQFFEKTKDVDRILQNLVMASGQNVKQQETLIIFDEIQECYDALNSLKYFCENAPGYHVACAGSLLGIALSKPVSFPVGKVDFLDVNLFHDRTVPSAGCQVPPPSPCLPSPCLPSPLLLSPLLPSPSLPSPTSPIPHRTSHIAHRPSHIHPLPHQHHHPPLFPHCT